ncbi:MAG: hypothetical protein QOH06_2185 [Acidobacteriota bacterium]|jgi:hypothetical protein|nr:hypothetical protein [Acidobacteriota bacterium]
MPGIESLYDLLPAVYRERDAELGKPLEALLRIVQGQADLVEADIRQLWENFFVETAEPWVVPYIGDLVGTTPLFDASRVQQPDTARDLFPDLLGPSLRPPMALRNRADVAKTIYFRRRKGTLPMLEELARDVTGWAAHAVEFFELLGWTQCVRNHLRMHSPRTPDLRRIELLDRLDDAFDEIAHTVDLRPIAQFDGWHNIKNIGFFLWRLRSHEHENIAARKASAGAWSYHFSPLGNPAPLFSRQRREGDEAGLATELHVPGPIRPLAFWKDVAAFYGPFDDGSASSSLEIYLNAPGQPPFQVPPSLILPAELGTWKQPSSSLNKKKIAVDVHRGRLALGTYWTNVTSVDVWYHHGFSTDLGGGSYPRRAWTARKPLKVIEVKQTGIVNTLAAALLQWNPNDDTVIRILDSRTYAANITIDPAASLTIEAADGVRPHLQGYVKIAGTKTVGSLTLSGLLIEGQIEAERPLHRIRLLHTTLVPGQKLNESGAPASTDPSVVCKEKDAQSQLLDYQDLRVELAFSITGPLLIPEGAAGLWVLDSIVDGVGTDAIAGLANGLSAPPTWLERVTILGPSRFKELTLASEVIFTEAAVADRLQEGCVRFSYIPLGSKTPRPYRCQPELEIAVREEEAKQAGKTLTSAERKEIRTWLVPSFTDYRYGQPAYAQLHLACPKQIRTGAEDGSEMGVFCHLKQPQRESNLRLRLKEYLPFGLEPGILYVT